MLRRIVTKATEISINPTNLMKSPQSPVDKHWLMQVTCDDISFIFFIPTAWQQSGTRSMYNH